MAISPTAKLPTAELWLDVRCVVVNGDSAKVVPLTSVMLSTRTMFSSVTFPVLVTLIV